MNRVPTHLSYHEGIMEGTSYILYRLIAVLIFTQIHTIPTRNIVIVLKVHLAPRRESKQIVVCIEHFTVQCVNHLGIELVFE